MFKVGKINIDKAILLAPMENVTDMSFRIICRELGADIVYTEFVNAEGLVRKNKNTHLKLKLADIERPAAIQIYGHNLDSMIGAAKIAEEENPDFIDINAGCWVKNVVGGGAGAALLKDPDYLQKIVESVVKAVNVPVTVKTRLGWDMDSIRILEIAKRIEDAGAAALVLHCRTRSQGHTGDADWTYINKVKEIINIPVGLNGNVLNAMDVKRAFEETNADAVMIARGAIGYPWIFREAKELLKYGYYKTDINPDILIETCLKHLKISVDIKGERRGVMEHRKFYTGYLKGLYGASAIRQKMMTLNEYAQVEEELLNYKEFLKTREPESYLN